jgi:hypothetical protein
VVALRLADDGHEFLRRELDIIDPIPRGGHTAGSTDLDEAGPGTELFADAKDAIVHTVDEAMRVFVGVDKLLGKVKRGVHMATRHSEDLAARENAGTAEYSPRHGAREVEPGLAHVPQAREARVQENTELIGSAKELVPEEGRFP